MMIQPGPLPSRKVLVLLVIHILFIIFLAITSCLLHIVLLCPLSTKNVNEALDHLGWQQAMIAEMQALDHNSTWELVLLLPREKKVGC